MINHHGGIALQIPATWNAPKFAFGQLLQAGKYQGQCVGIEFTTIENSAMTGTESGYWYYLLEPKTLPNGRMIADVGGYHESVIQLLPCDVSMYDKCCAVV